MSDSLSIGQVIRIHAWLQQHPDAVVDPVTEAPADDADLVLAWSKAAGHTGADPLQQAHALIHAVIWGVGALVGISTMSLALTYTGAYPVNLLVLLALFVGLPGLTLILSVVARLFWRGEGTHSKLEWMLSRLGPEYQDYLELNMWRYGEPLYWQSQGYFQRFTLVLLVSALLTLLCLIAFTDIAFGWSSTLRLEPAVIYTLTELLSLPWQHWLSVAHPSLELVEGSRFFRMNTDNNPVLLGQWWPFIAMSILVWAVLPRLMMAGLAKYQLRRSTRAALLNHPEVMRRLHQLRSSEVGFVTDTDGQLSAEEEPQSQIAITHIDTQVSIAWNGVETPGAVTLQLDAAMSSSEQTAQIAQLGANIQSVGVFVKGWEPPLLGDLDFLQFLRQQFGEQTTIIVVPQAPPGETLQASDLQVWRTRLTALHDPGIYVEHSS